MYVYMCIWISIFWKNIDIYTSRHLDIYIYICDCLFSTVVKAPIFWNIWARLSLQPMHFFAALLLTGDCYLKYWKQTVLNCSKQFHYAVFHYAFVWVFLFLSWFKMLSDLKHQTGLGGLNMLLVFLLRGFIACVGGSGSPVYFGGLGDPQNVWIREIQIASLIS